MKKSCSTYLPDVASSYCVQQSDSMASIAAQFNTTISVLKQLNRLMCDLVYPGQVLFVPNKVDQFPSNSCPNSPSAVQQQNAPIVPKMPLKLAGHVERLGPSSPTGLFTPPRPLSIDQVKRLNDQCDERFVKVHVNRIMHNEGVSVNGVILVTPDCVLFDPDESCPLVLEHGVAKYYMVVPMHSVLSVSVYHEKDSTYPLDDSPLLNREKCSSKREEDEYAVGGSAENQFTFDETPQEQSTIPFLVEASMQSGTSGHTNIASTASTAAAAAAAATVNISSGDSMSSSAAVYIHSDDNIKDDNSYAGAPYSAVGQPGHFVQCSVSTGQSVLNSQSSLLQRYLPDVHDLLPLHLCIGVCHSEKYCYSVPHDKIDPLYAFFIQWSYNGGEDKGELTDEQGFVVVDDYDAAVHTDSNLHSSDSSLHHSSSFNKDWEIVNLRELRRRISEAEVDNLPLPDLSPPSDILTDFHLRILMSHLPARAEGSSWCLVYSSSLHGFSLRTLYRQMSGIDSPVLLIIKDAAGQVFGTMQSSPVKKSDLFYGTGESYLFTFAADFKKFGWTGFNNFFTKGDNESLCFGASKGNYGLWLDGDLYHGRTQHCLTYNNDVLTVAEDFTIKYFEAWCFD